MFKICNKCGILKPIFELCKAQGCTFGVRCLCKLCKSEIDKQYGQVNEEKLKIQKKEYQEEHKEELREYRKKYYQKNKEKKQLQSKLWKQKNRQIINKKNKEGLKKNPAKKLIHYLRTRLNKVLDRNQKYGHMLTLLGCSAEELKGKIELLFYLNPKTGEQMTWDNRGQFGWHIDHIRPLSSFDLNDSQQQKEACHYSNLRPMWWFENLSKGAKF